MSQTQLPRRWAGHWRALGGALFVIGVSFPAAVFFLAGGTPSAFVVAQTLSLLAVGAAGAVYARHYSNRVGARLREAQWAITRATSAAGQIERFSDHPARLDHLAGEVEAIHSAIVRERSNLSMIASGMGVLRSRMDAERSNLGEIAHGLHEVRIQLATAEEALTKVGEQMTAERDNLGMVAGALDALRRSVVGVDRIHAKQSGLADLVIELADRVDAIDAAAVPVRLEHDPAMARPTTAKANGRRV